MPDHGWFDLVQDGSLEQGDLLEQCPVFYPPPTLEVDPTVDELADVPFVGARLNVAILSQSCDMVVGREKLDQVVLCQVNMLSDFKGRGTLDTERGKEDLRRGYLPNYWLFAEHESGGISRDFQVADFRRLFCLPIELVRKHAIKSGLRLRLKAPYREHLSHAFGRFFMRVGLPNELPSFKK